MCIRDRIDGAAQPVHLVVRVAGQGQTHVQLAQMCIRDRLLGLAGEACDQGGAQSDAGDLAAQLTNDLQQRCV